MADDRQASIIAIRLDFFHLADCKDNRLFSAGTPASGLHIARRGSVTSGASVGKVVLNADDQIAARGENVGEKGILGVAHRVAESKIAPKEDQTEAT
jgi:hypothetical protein